MADSADFLLGQIVTRLDTIEAWMKRVDDRLEQGDRQFQADARQDAAEGALRGAALRVGTWVLGVVSAVGLAVLSHIPLVSDWLIPKH